MSRTQEIEIVRLMEEERERKIGRYRGCKRVGRGRARKREKETEVGGRTLFRSFIRGRVQILNRILDECISLTRLRPVSTEGLRLLEVETA